MEKSTFQLGLISAAALLSACSGGGSKNQSENKQKNPNVVFLIADDLGIGDLSCYGATKIHTSTVWQVRDFSLQMLIQHLLQVHLLVSVFLPVCTHGVRKTLVSHRVTLN